jgi:hypothetical protein
MHSLATNEFPIDMEETLKILPVDTISVKDYISKSAGVSAADV